MKTIDDRFWEKVRKTRGCWYWTASTDPLGYGFFHVSGRKKVRAHRVAWELTNGPIPQGMLVCHTCDHPSCVRPDHLFLGTNDDNLKDMARKGRARNAHMGQTHCKRGHEFTPGNTIVRPNGARACRACTNARSRSGA